MIHSARPIVMPVVITILIRYLICFMRFLKLGTDGHTCENSDHYLPLGSASWINVTFIKQFFILNLYMP